MLADIAVNVCSDSDSCMGCCSIVLQSWCSNTLCVKDLRSCVIVLTEAYICAFMYEIYAYVCVCVCVVHFVLLCRKR